MNIARRIVAGVAATLFALGLAAVAVAAPTTTATSVPADGGEISVRINTYHDMG